MRARIKGLVLAVAAGFCCVGQAGAQKCPRGPVNVAELIAQMESTKDPNVILRAAAVGGWGPDARTAKTFYTGNIV